MTTLAGADGSTYLQSLTRAFDLLDALAASNGNIELATLARRVHLHPSTALRYLRSLEHRGYVHHDPEEGYRLGPRLFELGTAYAEAVSIYRYSDKLARDLSDATRETASVGILEGGSVLYVAIVNGQQEFGIQMQAGTRHPTHCTALGKAMLAFMPWDDAVEVLGAVPLVRLTPHTHVDLEGLRQDLQRIALSGYSVDDEELLAGVVCIGAPIFDHSHRVVAAVSISGPKARLPRRSWDTFAHLVMEAAAQASLHIGGRAHGNRVERAPGT
jgi:DNA-binding IclR family transcriptional regulator